MGMQASQKIDGITEVYPGFSLAPTGGKVMYVHASGAGALDYLPPGMSGNPDGFFQTVQAALASCRAGRGDKIVVLQGHTESIAIADAWSNLGTATDVEIVGMGQGTNRPTFTWTAAAATVLFDTANVKLRNCRLFLAGPHVNGTALTVAAPITVSATGGEITDCEIAYGFDADQIVAIGITVTGTRFNFSRNDCYGETAAVPTTTFLRLTGADFFRMDDTRIIGPGSTTAIGPVQMLTTACLKIQINRCVIQNMVAVSTVALTTVAACTGHLAQCYLGLGTGSLGVTAGSTLQTFNSFTFSAATGVATALAIT